MIKTSGGNVIGRVCELSWHPRGMPLHLMLRGLQHVVASLADARGGGQATRPCQDNSQALMCQVSRRETYHIPSTHYSWFSTCCIYSRNPGAISGRFNAKAIEVVSKPRGVPAS